MMERSKLIWVDLEFTGLAKDDVVIEIATVVTDSNLENMVQGPVIAIHQSEDIIRGMDDWNTTTHAESGLVDRIRSSDYDFEKAQNEILDFLKKHCEEGESPMCGNSVHVDRWYMKKDMPKLEEFFNYRNVDVSTIKELAVRWMDEIPLFEKKATHKALEDILESIDELIYYREKIFRISNK